MAEQVPDLEAVESPPRRRLDYHQLSLDEDPIGGGGQGIVYRAGIPDATPPDKIAVKEPAVDSRTLDSDEIEMFLEEASTWETVDRREREKRRWRDSEYIVGVVDTGDDLPWIAMEYMDGGGLDDRLEASPDGLPIDEALWIGECVCRGVELAHNCGIAHLDLKPANVLFRQTAGGVWDVPKIADWGLARVLAERTGTMDGLSVTYAAPEQFEPDEFGDPDMLTDVYQVGALVYTMLTGRPPYTGSQASIIHDVVYGGQPALASSERPALSPEVDEPVMTALATEKSDRYRNIAAFEQALRAIRTETLDGQSHTGDESAPEPTPKTTERTDSWPRFQGGFARTGHRSTSAAPDSVTTQWRFQTDSQVRSSPTVDDDTVYVGSDDCHVYALDASNGTERWRFQTDNWVRPSPTVDDDTVYVGSDDCHVYALDASNGTERWRFQTDRRVYSPPMVADSTIYVGSSDSNVYALDASDGTERWRFQTDDWVYSSPAVASGTVYVGSFDGHVYALDASDGTERWRFQTDNFVRPSPTVVNGTIYVGNDDGHVYALDASSGTERWRFQTDNFVRPSPAVADGTVYVGSDDYHVYALDASDGTERWRFQTDGHVRSSPTIADSTVYVGSDDYHVYALDTSNGTERWHFQTDGSIHSSPTIADGTVYVGSNDGYVYALTDDG
ncbi:serine/threonine-protein kinase [Halomicrobium mukohataei]|nr:serine/threonine-protein kinase [Halomicrobium mukohataei]